MGQSNPQPAMLNHSKRTGKSFTCRICNINRSYQGWEDAETNLGSDEKGWYSVHLGCLIKHVQKLEQHCIQALNLLKLDIANQPVSQKILDAATILETGLNVS